MNGHYPTGRALIFDDDHYYMGSVIAEKLIVFVNIQSVTNTASILSDMQAASKPV
jgi:dimethylamine/trimethylamine dehydrogenase